MSERQSRRRFLRSAGVTITLPLLPSLLHERRARAAPCAPAKRFLAYIFPDGHHMPESLPAGVGAGARWQLPPMYASFADLKSDLLFVSGLENQQRRREFGDHAIGCGAVLTARKPTADTPFTNHSIDQVLADAQSAETGCGSALPSWQLGTQNAGPADEFGTYYTRTVSWRGPVVPNADGTTSFPAGNATPLGKETDPAKAFDRLFAGSDPTVSATEAARRRALRKSVLDTVVPHGDWLRNRLNAADRGKVDELFTGIRALELEIDRTTPPAATCMKPPAPAGGRLPVPDQLAAMHGLIAVAFQCDLTRVITFMMGDPLTDRSFSFVPDVAAVGGDAGEHAVSHHSNQAPLVAKYRAMILWKMARIAELVRKLKGLQDADGQSMLASTLVMITSELGDGNRHNHDDIPILLAGQLGGRVVTDRHVRFPTGNDYTKVKTFGDFFITLMGMWGVRATAFGNDGKEAISWNA